MSWLSKAIKKSKRKGTGLFSWGKNISKGASKMASWTKYIPGVGAPVSGALNAISKASSTLPGKSGRNSRGNAVVRIKQK